MVKAEAGCTNVVLLDHFPFSIVVIGVAKEVTLSSGVVVDAFIGVAPCAFQLHIVIVIIWCVWRIFSC